MKVADYNHLKVKDKASYESEPGKLARGDLLSLDRGVRTGLFLMIFARALSEGRELILFVFELNPFIPFRLSAAQEMQS